MILTRSPLGVVERGDVERVDVVPAFEQVADQIDAQEAGAAGDEVMGRLGHGRSLVVVRERHKQGRDALDHFSD